jgi:hypothetical protein
MKLSTTKQLETDATWLSEAHFVSAEVDNLIASAEARIERQRKYIRAASNDESSRRMLADLDTMTATLEKLKTYRARITEDDKRAEICLTGVKTGSQTA